MKPLLSQEQETKEEAEEVLVQPIGTGTIATTDTGNNQSFCLKELMHIHSLGTPIVEMYSSFGSLPDNSKWGVNMSGEVLLLDSR